MRDFEDCTKRAYSKFIGKGIVPISLPRQCAGQHASQHTILKFTLFALENKTTCSHTLVIRLSCLFEVKQHISTFFSVNVCISDTCRTLFAENLFIDKQCHHKGHD